MALTTNVIIPSISNTTLVWNGGSIYNTGNISAAGAAGSRAGAGGGGMLKAQTYNNAGYNTTLSTSIAPSPPLTITNDLGETTMVITSSGEVKFFKTPNEATRKFMTLCEHHIDKKAAGINAIQRSYRRGVEKCLRLARTMEKDQLILLLEQEINVRLGSEMMQLLRKEGKE